MRIKYLLNALKCPNTELQVAIVLICKANKEGGKTHDFEAATVYLIPADPVTKKHISGKKRDTAKLSSIESNGAPKGP